MGLYLGFSKSSYDSYSYKIPKFNPNPFNFRIKSFFKKNGFLALVVEYPDCFNFEGNKILLYKTNISPQEIVAKNGGSLDPHFSQNKDYISPVARFEPTALGFDMVNKFINMTSSEDNND